MKIIDFKSLRKKFVKYIYADHNNSIIVKRKLKECINKIGINEYGLNIGSGDTNLGKNIRNLDIFSGKSIYYKASAEKIPEIDNFFSLVISQESLEHIQNPRLAVKEIYRVLKKNGLFYCQVPFIIGYHPGPTDFWRFTKEGLNEIISSQGFKILESGITVGGGTGFYRISVEFFATLLSLILPKTYFIFKGIFSLIFFPIKYFDIVFKYSKQADRIAGGYYIIAKK